MLQDKIIISRKKVNIVEEMPNPIIYSPLKYGIDNKCTGKGVKIAVLDSGCPNHKDIKVEGEKISLCDENSNTNDKNGHATMVSGIIKSDNKNTIVGLAPHSKLLFGKITNNKGQCDFNALIAGVLWGIVKEVDIIIIAMGGKYDYRVLYDAVKKAKSRGICVFAAAGDDEVVNYPAKYKEIFSTGFLTKNNEINEKMKKKINLYLPNKSLYSTYLDNKYVKVGGSSISTSFFAWLGAVLIEQYKRENKRNIPKLVYDKLKTVV